MTTRKVKTESELRYYLNKKYWDCIMIAEEMSIDSPIIIKKRTSPLRIMCMRDITVWNDYIGDKNGHSLFVVDSDFVIFECVSIFTTPILFTNDYLIDGLQSAIKFNSGTGGMVIDSRIEEHNWGAIWQFNHQKLTVSNNVIYGAGTPYFNYGVWQGPGSPYDQRLYFIDNTVQNVRHAIGASGHPNSYYAIGNTISTTKHSFDRHNQGTAVDRFGGLHTHISGNTFLDTDRLAFSVEPPHDGGSFSFTGNKLNHAKERHVGEIAGDKVYERASCMGSVGIFGNEFNK